MEPEDNNGYGYDEEEEGQSQSNREFKLKGGKGVSHKLKSGLKIVGANSKNAIKAGIKAIFKKYLLKYVIIALIIVVIMAAFVLILNEVSVKDVTSGTSSYFSSADNLDKIGEEAKEIYDESGSLVLATDSVIKEISNLYLLDMKQRYSTVYDELKKEKIVGIHNISDIKYTKGFDIANASEFILNAERLNFNRIIWKEVSREGEVDDLSLMTDEKTKLNYPKSEEDGKELADFARMVTPYLQSYIVSSSMVSGLSTEKNQENISNFAYQIIHNGYNKIRINQYNVQNITRYKPERHYIIMTFTIETFEKEEEYIGTCKDKNGNSYRCTKKRTVHGYKSSTFSSQLAQARAEYKKLEAAGTANISYAETLLPTYAAKDKMIGNDYVYAIVEAQTLNQYMTNNYMQVIYNETDVENFQNYDTMTRAAVFDYEDINGLTGRATSGAGWTSTGTVTYTIEIGQRITYQYYWQDKLELINQDSRSYTVEDIDSYIDSGEIILKTYNTPLVIVAGTVLEEEEEEEEEEYEFKALTEDEIQYYRAIQEDDEINKIDIINAVPSLFKEYIEKDEQYSEHIGFPRTKLTEGYRLMSKYLSGLTDSIDTSQLMHELSKNIRKINLGTVIGTNFIYPLDPAADSDIQSCTGARILNGKADSHRGVDLGAGQGTAIVASQDGVVISRGTVSGGGMHWTYGNAVVIKHDQDPENTYYTVYAHMVKEPLVKIGDTVEAGDVIGYVGSTGNSTGNHLHFELAKYPKGAAYTGTSQYLLEPLLYVQKNTIPDTVMSPKTPYPSNCGDITSSTWGSLAKQGGSATTEDDDDGWIE